MKQKIMAQKLQEKENEIIGLMNLINASDPSKTSNLLKRCLVCCNQFRVSEADSHMCRDNMRSITCDHCHKPFRSVPALQVHLNIFHRIKASYECELCTAKFGMFLLYEIHLEKRHADVFADEMKQVEIESTEFDELDEFKEDRVSDGLASDMNSISADLKDNILKRKSFWNEF